MPPSKNQISDQSSPITAIDWLTVSHLVVAQKNGKVSIIDLSSRKEDESKDICIAHLPYNPVWSLVVIDETNIAIACDSGHVYLLNRKETDSNEWSQSVIT